MFKHKIAQFIEHEGLLKPDDKVLVALSGGADSVALLRVLLSLGYRCEAAHCNFHLRGQESDRDERFVRELCAKKDVPFHVIQFETYGYAAEKKISIEMAARELRYTWFAEIKDKCRASAIAVAHHQDDSIETMLINLIRGTGIDGLLGIRPRNGDIVRPLLNVDREEILQYLSDVGQDYITDSTNLSDEFVRNKVRLKLIPLMQEINPSVKQSLSNTAHYLSGAADIYHIYIGESKKRILTNEGINIELLLKEPSPRAVLFGILHPLGFNPDQIDTAFGLVSAQPGKFITSHTGCRIAKDRGLLLINKPNKDEPAPTLTIEKKVYSPDFIIPRAKAIACLDADTITQPFYLRKWQHGDSFVPFGMKGRKLISDYMTDRKFSLSRKENQWLLCSGEDIVWVVGERIDNRFRINEKTQRLYIITFTE